MDANTLIDKLRSRREFKHVKTNTLMAAGVHHLARKGMLHITIHQLIIIYKVNMPHIIKVRKLIDKVAQQ
jgi:hypothetical protein